MTPNDKKREALQIDIIITTKIRTKNNKILLRPYKNNKDLLRTSSFSRTHDQASAVSTKLLVF